MAKKTKTPPTAGKLAGKTFAFAGKFGYANQARDTMSALIAAEGGAVVEPEQTAPDYLIVGYGVGGKPPAAVAKFQKKYPQVQTIDQGDFYQLVIPTAEEFLEILRSGPHGHEF